MKAKHTGRLGNWGIYTALSLLIALLVAATLFATAYADSKYTVQPGDTLTAIAERHNVTVQAIVVANNLSSPSVIYVGQVLTIPATESSPASGTPSPSPTSITGPPTSIATATLRSAVASNTPTALLQPQAGTTTPVPVNSAAGAELGTPVKYTVQRGDSLSSIAYQFDTTVEALQSANNVLDPNRLEVGQVLELVKGNKQNGPPDKPKPVEPQTPMGKLGPKWIELDLSTQMLVAYEGQTPVFSARMSSGKAGFPTVTGSYRVYLKYRTQRMRGMQGTPEAYDIPNVPHVMYFFEGYGIHGAYWHNNFGTPASHGCINLPLDAAKWMYEWAPMSTIVVSHK